MDFGERMKAIRVDRAFTQQQMADKLNVSRQAISNWENNRNLPDIEMLIEISKNFNLTLDELILGGTDMNNMVEKLILDGSEKKRMELSLKCIRLGVVLLMITMISFIGAVIGPVTFENFFVGISYLSFFGSVVAFLVAGVKNLIKLFKKTRKA